MGDHILGYQQNVLNHCEKGDEHNRLGKSPGVLEFFSFERNHQQVFAEGKICNS